MNDIVLKNISLSFGEKVVLKDLSVTFKGGEITCIGGPSGYGKTTLLNVIAGLLKADEGQIEGVSDKISFVFQENRLCDDFTAVKNLKIVCGNKTCGDKIIGHLSLLGLENDLKKPVREFSGGMKRRVAIARAMLYTSDVILMDEPFRGLDEKLKQSVMDYVMENRNGRTLICVTHDKSEAEYLGAEYLDITKLNNK